MDKIERQLRRYKDKLKTHHGRERVHHRQDLVNQLSRVRHAVFEMPGEEAQYHSEPEPKQAKTEQQAVKADAGLGLRACCAPPTSP